MNTCVGEPQWEPLPSGDSDDTLAPFRRTYLASSGQKPRILGILSKEGSGSVRQGVSEFLTSHPGTAESPVTFTGIHDDASFVTGAQLFADNGFTAI